MAFPIPHDLIILLHCWASVAACTIEFTVMVDFPDPCRFFFFFNFAVFIWANNRVSDFRPDVGLSGSHRYN